MDPLKKLVQRKDGSSEEMDPIKRGFQRENGSSEKNDPENQWNHGLSEKMDPEKRWIQWRWEDSDGIRLLLFVFFGRSAESADVNSSVFL